jgi:hypothetical protein
MWLSPEVFAWTPWYSSGKTEDVARWKRPYDLHAHAEKLVLAAASELSIADAVVNLRRAIGMRVQHLEELYRFKWLFPQIPASLDRLEAVGLARPFLIHQLVDLRNDIEHKDAKAPNAARSRELADVTWYFLKTTDYACKVVPRAVDLTEDPDGPTSASNEPRGFLTITVDSPLSETYKVAGWVPLAWLADSAGPGWIRVTVESVRTKHDLPGVDNILESMRGGANEVPLSVVPLDDELGAHVFANAMRREDERLVIGQIHPSMEQRQRICHLLLASL